MMNADRPSPCDIRSARHKTGFTMEEAGAIVFVSRKTWLSWERDVGHPDHRDMHPAIAQLFALKVGLVKLEDVAPLASVLKERLARLERKWD